VHPVCWGALFFYAHPSLKEKTLQKVLETLVNLQDIDSDLFQLEETKGDLPQKVKSLEREYQQAKTTLEAKQAEKKSMFSEKTAAEQDAAAAGEKLKKFKVQLYQVKNNKEYDAITAEIEVTQNMIDELEYRALELDENMQKLEEDIEAAQETVDMLQKDLETKKQELGVKLGATQEQEDKLLAQRENIAGKLNTPLMRTYERIRQARHGVAVAHLEDGACNACSSRIPPQRAMEIRMGGELHMCEVCGRILVYVPETESVNSDIEEK